MTANIGQIHSMLLEEALLYLLEVSGYRTVESAVVNGKRDPTLQDSPAGLEVLGRGGVHQIDTVADLVIAQPFSSPQRLLLEAKFRTQKTGIDAIRNAIGILKDINEYWVFRDKLPPKAQYHYQYAIFSTSSYTSVAEKYAYAHDIYLIPLARSAFFKPIINAIQTLNINCFNTPITDKSFGQLRKAVRERLRDSKSSTFRDLIVNKSVPLIEDFFRECRWLNGVLLGMIARQFPILLVPHPDLRIDELKNQYKVEIQGDGEGFYLRQANSNKNLFSFDLPEELFKLYAKQGLLTDMETLDSKSKDMAEIQATLMYDGQARIITFEFEREWIDKYCNRLSGNLDEDGRITDERSR